MVARRARFRLCPLRPGTCLTLDRGGFAACCPRTKECGRVFGIASQAGTPALGQEKEDRVTRDITRDLRRRSERGAVILGLHHSARDAAWPGRAQMREDAGLARLALSVKAEWQVQPARGQDVRLVPRSVSKAFGKGENQSCRNLWQTECGRCARAIGRGDSSRDGEKRHIGTLGTKKHLDRHLIDDTSTASAKRGPSRFRSFTMFWPGLAGYKGIPLVAKGIEAFPATGRLRRFGRIGPHCKVSSSSPTKAQGRGG